MEAIPAQAVSDPIAMRTVIAVAIAVLGASCAATNRAKPGHKRTVEEVTSQGYEGGQMPSRNQREREKVVSLRNG
jgi:hypothetical protein